MSKPSATQAQHSPNSNASRSSLFSILQSDFRSREVTPSSGSPYREEFGRFAEIFKLEISFYILYMLEYKYNKLVYPIIFQIASQKLQHTSIKNIPIPLIPT